MSIRTYLICGISVWLICSIIISYNCQCDGDTNNLELHNIRNPRKDRSAISTTKETTFLLVIIMSSPMETERRQTIRETWLKLSTKGRNVFTPIFPIGTKDLNTSIIEELKQEHEKYSDLSLIEDLEEAYNLLAKKTLKSMIYAYEKFKFQYVLKVDSDSFVRLSIFLNALMEIQHPRLYWGFLDGRAKPIRKGKWKESDWILCDRYLPYQLGGGYVLSYELVKFLAVNAPLLKLYNSEDVAVGAWLAGLDVKYVHDPRFDTEWVSRGCNNQYLITHKKSAEDMRNLFANLKERKVLCKKEYRSRYSYVYDWSAVPSKCCERINGSMIP